MSSCIHYIALGRGFRPGMPVPAGVAAIPISITTSGSVPDFMSQLGLGNERSRKAPKKRKLRYVRGSTDGVNGI